MAGLLHDPGFRFTGDNGNILAGGKIYTYVAGTTTNKATYKEQAESNAHTNPIILDADGTAPGGTGIWLLTDELYKIRIDDANDSTIATFDNVAAAGGTLTSGITLGGNLDVNGFDITSNSNGNIDINPNGTGVTNLYDPVLQDNLLTNNKNIAINDDKGIVETSSLNEILMFTGTASAVNYLQIASEATGNNPIIEAKGDDANVGITLTPKGSGQITIDNNIWPAADGSAGQIIETDGSTNLSFVTPDCKFQSIQTASASATLDFDNVFSAGVDKEEFIISNLVPATDGATLHVRVGTGATPTYQSGASDYSWIGMYQTGAAGASDAADSEIDISLGLGVGSDTGEAFNGTITVYNPSSASGYCTITWEGTLTTSAGVLDTVRGTGQYLAATAVTSLRFLMSSGNIASGTISHRSYKAS